MSRHARLVSPHLRHTLAACLASRNRRVIGVFPCVLTMQVIRHFPCVHAHTCGGQCTPSMITTCSSPILFKTTLTPCSRQHPFSLRLFRIPISYTYPLPYPFNKASRSQLFVHEPCAPTTVSRSKRRLVAEPSWPPHPCLPFLLSAPVTCQCISS